MLSGALRRNMESLTGKVTHRRRQMNWDECLHATIKSSVDDVLERMKSLDAQDRCALMLEHMENLAFDDEDVLMVPNFQT